MTLRLRARLVGLTHLLIGHPRADTVEVADAGGYVYCLACGAWATRGDLLGA